jgi:hypothetical protein
MHNPRGECIQADRTITRGTDAGSSRTGSEGEQGASNGPAPPRALLAPPRSDKVAVAYAPAAIRHLQAEPIQVAAEHGKCGLCVLAKTSLSIDAPASTTDKETLEVAVRLDEHWIEAQASGVHITAKAAQGG